MLNAAAGQGLGWWEGANEEIWKFSKHERQTSTPPAPIQKIMRDSNIRRVSPQGWALLRSKGLRPGSALAAYQLLSTLLSKEKKRSQEEKTTAMLKEQVRERQQNIQAKANRKKQVYRLVAELQHRRQLSSLREQGGGVTRDPQKIAQKLAEYWGGIMTNPQRTEQECLQYLETLGIPPRLGYCVPLLWRPLTRELVETALGRLPRGSSPGEDGISAEIYQAYPEIFVPRMLDAMQGFVSAGEVPHSWSGAIIRPIPKLPGVPTEAATRPICLQNVRIKWVSMIILLQAQDAMAQIIPQQQKGFVRGRCMLDHVIDVRGLWEGRGGGGHTCPWTTPRPLILFRTRTWRQSCDIIKSPPSILNCFFP